MGFPRFHLGKKTFTCSTHDPFLLEIWGAVESGQLCHSTWSCLSISFHTRRVRMSPSPEPNHGTVTETNILLSLSIQTILTNPHLDRLWGRSQPLELHGQLERQIVLCKGILPYRGLGDTWCCSVLLHKVNKFPQVHLEEYLHREMTDVMESALYFVSIEN